MDKPVMRSITEFSDYLATHLGMARIMRRLSRDDEYLVHLDTLMSERWASVINGRCPSPQQREVALRERENVVGAVCRGMHDFCELYANFPTLAPVRKMALEPLPWDKEERV